MASRPLTIHVAPEAARDYQTASADVQRQVDAILSRKLREILRGFESRGASSETSVPSPPEPRLTAQALLDSGLVGLWKDRSELEDSSAFARYLRDKAQRRSA